MSTETRRTAPPGDGAAAAPPAPPPVDRPGTDDNEFTAVRHVYEPHRVGLPPIGTYLREVWRRREFALTMSRTNLRAQHVNTAFGMAWLIINPLLLATVYFILVDILHRGSRGPSFFAHLVAGLFAYYFVQQTATQSVKSVTSGGRQIGRASCRERV